MLNGIDRFIIMGLLVTGSAAILIGLHAGFPERLTRDVDLSPNYGLHKSCDGAFSENCIENSIGTSSVVLVGDSLAMSISKGLFLATKPSKFSQVTQSSCTPMISPNIGGCEWLDFTIAHETEEGDKIFIASTFNQIRRPQNLKRFSSEITRLSKVNIVTVVIPAPYFKETSRCLKRAILFSRQDKCLFDVSTAMNNDVRASLINLIEAHSLNSIDLADIFCSAGKCSPLVDGTPLVRDNLHFSIDAVSFLRKFFEANIR